VTQFAGDKPHSVVPLNPFWQLMAQAVHVQLSIPPHPSGVGPQSAEVQTADVQSVVVVVEVVVVEVVVVVSQRWSAV
jgi:hypothetical protein